MRWDLHGIIIDGQSNDKGLADAWQRSFASLESSTSRPDLRVTLDLVRIQPAPPAAEPDYTQGKLLAYYVNGKSVRVYFPRFGLLELDLEQGTTAGQILPEALGAYGVLEDLIAIALSPHLRRRGSFLIHAFAAATDDRAVLLVGSIGAGKTTTGMALLNDGWRVLSNDSPIIQAGGSVLRYPGVLAAYPETYARFSATQHLVAVPNAPRAKLTAPIEAIWPDCWLESAPIGAICFPVIEERADHALEEIPSPQALAQLLPHAIEQWDKAMMPNHLGVLRELVEAAPAYRLRLGPEVATIPGLLRRILESGP